MATQVGHTVDRRDIRDDLFHKLVYEFGVLDSIKKRHEALGIPEEQWELNVILEAFVLHWTNIVEFLVAEHQQLAFIVVDSVASDRTLVMRKQFRELLRSPSKAIDWGCGSELPLVDVDASTGRVFIEANDANVQRNTSVYSNLKNSILVGTGRTSVKFRVSWYNMAMLAEALQDVLNAAYFLPDHFFTSDGVGYTLYDTVQDGSTSTADTSA